MTATSIIRPVDASVKERLTGALIFVAAVVIVVPEMLSGPGRHATSVESAVGAAEEAAPMRTYSVPVSGEAPPGTAAALPAVTAPEPVAAESMPQPTEPASTAVPAASAEAAAGTVESAVASAASVAAPAAKQQEVSSGSWWTQVGIFSSRDNADRLARKLRTAGFEIEISKYVSGGKDMFRVRSGPVKDRAEALALQARLKAAGHAALLVAP